MLRNPCKTIICNAGYVAAVELPRSLKQKLKGYRELLSAVRWMLVKVEWTALQSFPPPSDGVSVVQFDAFNLKLHEGTLREEKYLAAAFKFHCVAAIAWPQALLVPVSRESIT